MAFTCKTCKYGLDRIPDGKRPPQGTVWCSRRKINMGQTRNLSCFVPLISEKSRRCQDCKWSKRYTTSNQPLKPGNVWCDRRRFEINKLRTMECFE